MRGNYAGHIYIQPSYKPVMKVYILLLLISANMQQEGLDSSPLSSATRLNPSHHIGIRDQPSFLAADAFGLEPMRALGWYLRM